LRTFISNFAYSGFLLSNGPAPFVKEVLEVYHKYCARDKKLKKHLSSGFVDAGLIRGLG